MVTATLKLIFLVVSIENAAGRFEEYFLEGCILSSHKDFPGALGWAYAIISRTNPGECFDYLPS